MKALFFAQLILVLLAAPLAAEPLVTVLDNGLTVITEEMHYAPVIAYVVSYRVGARNEREDLAGISHFCEHLMFKGTPSMPKGRFWQIVQRDGGMTNAFTSEDVTVYFLVLPSNRLEDALRIESDRMVNCLFDSAEVVSERNVVHEERRMGVDDPEDALYEAMNLAAYTVHPYRNPVVGFDETILSYDHISAREYYEIYYNPANAVLTVIGDFETEELLEDVEQYFGSIPGGTDFPEPHEIEPPQTSRRYVEVEHESNLARFLLVFHIPDATDPDSPVLDLIAAYLSSGRASRLEETLVEAGVASSAYARNYAGIDPGLFVIGVTMMPDIDPAEAEQIVWDELDALATDDLPQEVLEDLKTRARARDILEAVTPLGRAFDLGLSMTMYGNPFQSDENLAVIEATTTDDIRRVAGAYFRNGTETLALLVPTGGGGQGISREREELPTDIQEPSSIDYEGLEIPSSMLISPSISTSDNVVTWTLNCGLTVMVKEDHSFPVVSVSFAIPLGSFREDPALAGLADITAEMMIRGTRELGYTEFHDRLESLGSYLRFGASYEYSTGAITMLSEDIDTALRTVADVLIRPAFLEEDLTHVKEEAIAGIERSRENVFRVSGENLMKMIVARPELAHVPDEETIAAIGLNTSFAFFQACSRPTGSCITIVGDVDTDEIFAVCRELFGEWEDPKSDLPPVVVPTFTDEPGHSSVATMPGRMQAAVGIGTPAPGYGSTDYVPFSVMNQILGRGISSRLGHFVRDDQGLAYAVWSYNNALSEQGLFIAFLSTRADYTEQAITSVLSETMRMASENVLDIELDLVKANAVGRNALSSMSYSGQAGYLTGTYMRGQPLDYDIQTLDERLELTPDQLREVAAKYFTGDWFTSVAGGVDEELNPVFQ